MGRDPLRPTPNIPWGWNHDDEGNILLSIRASNGELATVVLDEQQARGFCHQLGSLFWKRDSEARSKRLGT